MKKIIVLLGITFAIGILVTLYINESSTETSVESAINTPTAVEKNPAMVDYKVAYLDQNWSDEIRNEWWYTSQGSSLIPYSWFRVLEQANNEELLSSDKNMKRLGFIPGSKDDKWNPNRLPIGFVTEKIPNSKEVYLGVTCAACHTGQIEYQGKRFIIEGGPAHADFDRFVTEMAKALQITLDDDNKFKRLADKYFDGGYGPDKAKELRDQMAKISTEFSARVERNRPPHPNGYGRLDAFGNIFNEVVVTAINEPDNVNSVDAPVSYPVLWDTPQHDVVQWNGAAVNAGIGPYVRNAGEVVGVFGGVRVEKDDAASTPGKLQYLHHIDLENLKRLEDILVTLWSPVWPETLLPAIDQTKTEQGKRHYDKLCVSCHEAIDRKDPNRQIEAKMIPLKEIGTDPLMAENSVKGISKTGILEGQPKIPLPNVPVFGPQAPSGELVGNVIFNILLQGLPEMLEPDELKTGLSEYLQAKAKSSAVPLGYKARPLNGIWASAPFLHNGSVANLWELLKKPNDRMQQFYVGSSELDPVHVGFSTDDRPLTSKLDTTLPGNSNQGHNYGTDLSDTSKLELIEYIKTL